MKSVVRFVLNEKKSFFCQIKVRLLPKDCANTVSIFRDNVPYFDYYKIIIIALACSNQ